MDFVLGALSACGACLFSNPLDVIKTKAQLQGELRARGQYKVHYKNMGHAAYLISREEGILALQKGLVPALWFQVFLNGTRLGLFQIAENHGLTRKPDGSVSLSRTLIVSAVAGSAGAFIGSPFYLVKTQIQSYAPVAVSQSKDIALGVQHKHEGMITALKKVYQRGGLTGMWAGAGGNVLRSAIGSCAQLSTFSTCKEYIEKQQFFEEDAIWTKAFASSMLVGVMMALLMSPFDTIATRIYNQSRDASGRGLMYSSLFDCLAKTFRAEGVRGLYKGVMPVYVRIAPHSTLNLMFWEKMKEIHKDYVLNKEL